MHASVPGHSPFCRSARTRPSAPQQCCCTRVHPCTRAHARMHAHTHAPTHVSKRACMYTTLARTPRMHICAPHPCVRAYSHTCAHTITEECWFRPKLQDPQHCRFFCCRDAKPRLVITRLAIASWTAIRPCHATATSWTLHKYSILVVTTHCSLCESQSVACHIMSRAQSNLHRGMLIQAQIVRPAAWWIGRRRPSPAWHETHTNTHEHARTCTHGHTHNGARSHAWTTKLPYSHARSSMHARMHDPARSMHAQRGTRRPSWSWSGATRPAAAPMRLLARGRCVLMEEPLHGGVCTRYRARDRSARGGASLFRRTSNQARRAACGTRVFGHVTWACVQTCA